MCFSLGKRRRRRNPCGHTEPSLKHLDRDADSGMSCVSVLGSSVSASCEKLSVVFSVCSGAMTICSDRPVIAKADCVHPRKFMHSSGFKEIKIYHEGVAAMVGHILLVNVSSKCFNTF